MIALGYTKNLARNFSLEAACPFLSYRPSGNLSDSLLLSTQTYLYLCVVFKITAPVSRFLKLWH